MIRAMTGLLAELGGELHLGVEVARIDVSGGRTGGVSLADGRSFGARRAVIANVAPRLLFGKLLRDGSGNPDFDRRMRALRAGRLAKNSRARGAFAERSRARKP
jgi:phytoene dehydrogenase-like protein